MRRQLGARIHRDTAASGCRDTAGRGDATARLRTGRQHTSRDAAGSGTRGPDAATSCGAPRCNEFTRRRGGRRTRWSWRPAPTATASTAGGDARTRHADRICDCAKP